MSASPWLGSSEAVPEFLGPEEVDAYRAWRARKRAEVEELWERLGRGDPNSDIRGTTIVNDVESAGYVARHLMSAALRHRWHACDTETHGWNPEVSPWGSGRVIATSHFVGPGVDFGSGSRVFVDATVPGVLDAFKPYWEDEGITKVYHNYTYDRAMLSNMGIKAKGFACDTMGMARLWDSSRSIMEGGTGYGLGALCEDLLGGDGVGGDVSIVGRSLSKIDMFTRFKMRFTGVDAEKTADDLDEATEVAAAAGELDDEEDDTEEEDAEEEEDEEDDDDDDGAPLEGPEDWMEDVESLAENTPVGAEMDSEMNRRWERKFRRKWKADLQRGFKDDEEFEEEEDEDGADELQTFMPDTLFIQTCEESKLSWIQYSTDDAVLTWALRNRLQNLLDEQEWVIDGSNGGWNTFTHPLNPERTKTMWDFYCAFTSPFSVVLADLEDRGLYVGQDMLDVAERTAMADAYRCEAFFVEWLRKNTPNVDAGYFNLDSAEQLNQLLFGGGPKPGRDGGTGILLEPPGLEGAEFAVAEADEDGRLEAEGAAHREKVKGWVLGMPPSERATVKKTLESEGRGDEWDSLWDDAGDGDDGDGQDRPPEEWSDEERKERALDWLEEKGWLRRAADGQYVPSPPRESYVALSDVFGDAGDVVGQAHSDGDPGKAALLAAVAQELGASDPVIDGAEDVKGDRDFYEGERVNVNEDAEVLEEEAGEAEWIDEGDDLFSDGCEALPPKYVYEYLGLEPPSAEQYALQQYVEGATALGELEAGDEPDALRQELGIHLVEDEGERQAALREEMWRLLGLRTDGKQAGGLSAGESVSRARSAEDEADSALLYDDGASRAARPSAHDDISELLWIRGNRNAEEGSRRGGKDNDVDGDGDGDEEGWEGDDGLVLEFGTALVEKRDKIFDPNDFSDIEEHAPTDAEGEGEGEGVSGANRKAKPPPWGSDDAPREPKWKKLPAARWFSHHKTVGERLKEIKAKEAALEVEYQKKLAAHHAKVAQQQAEDIANGKKPRKGAKPPQRKKVRTNAIRKFRVVGLQLEPPIRSQAGGMVLDHVVLEALAGTESEPGPAFGQVGEKGCQALRMLAHAKKIDTLATTFLWPLKEYVTSGRNDSRIRASLNINTETGRLSSRRPNLQNQPSVDKDFYGVRACFCAPPGKALVVADYGQLELRLLAHMSGCKSMIEAFALGGDFHSRTAMGMYPYIDKDMRTGEVVLERRHQEDTTPTIQEKYADERKKAKMLNFSIAYGKTSSGLAQSWGVSQAEADETVARWFNDRPEVKIWQDRRKEYGQWAGISRTLLGRNRALPRSQWLDPTRKDVEVRERVAINSPIQGGAADVVTLAMLKLNASQPLKDMGYMLILQIHDEIVMEGPLEHLDDAIGEITNCMQNPFPNGWAPLRVALDVDARHAHNWMDGK